MALIPTKGPIPRGAEIIPRHLVLDRQKELIADWKPKSDVWALQYGNGILGAGASVCGMVINSFFRQPLQLRHLGRSLSYLSLTVGPALLSAVLHASDITERIVQYKFSCPICLETNASLNQVGSSILYALILAPTVNLGVAASYGLQVPDIRDVKHLAKFWWSTTKPMLPALSFMFSMNVLFASLITYKEIKQMEFVKNILLKMEDDYQRKHSNVEV